MAKRCVTTAKDFELFKKTAKQWLDYFGMKGWEVYFEHSEDCEKPAFAWCRIPADTGNLPNRVATIGLQIEWETTGVTAAEIKKSAFHEVCELLFSRLEALAHDRFVMERELREETHHIIRTLENTVFRDVQP